METNVQGIHNPEDTVAFEDGTECHDALIRFSTVALCCELEKRRGVPLSVYVDPYEPIKIDIGDGKILYGDSGPARIFVVID